MISRLTSECKLTFILTVLSSCILAMTYRLLWYDQKFVAHEHHVLRCNRLRALGSSIDRVSIKFLVEISSLPSRSHDLLMFVVVFFSSLPFRSFLCLASSLSIFARPYNVHDKEKLPIVLFKETKTQILCRSLGSSLLLRIQRFYY